MTKILNQLSDISNSFLLSSQKTLSTLSPIQKSIIIISSICLGILVSELLKKYFFSSQSKITISGLLKTNHNSSNLESDKTKVSLTDLPKINHIFNHLESKETKTTEMTPSDSNQDLDSLESNKTPVVEIESSATNNPSNLESDKTTFIDNEKSINNNINNLNNIESDLEKANLSNTPTNNFKALENYSEKELSKLFLANYYKDKDIEDELSGMNFNTKIEWAIKAGSSLQFLSLDFSYSTLTEEKWNELIGACPNIEELHLENVSKEAAKSITELPNLLIFELEKFKSLPENLFKKLTSECSLIIVDYQNPLPFQNIKENKKINKLHLIECSITDDEIQLIPENILHVQLKKCNKITGINFSSFHSKLSQLALFHCDNLKNESIGNLPDTIKELWIENCQNLDKRCLSENTIRTGVF